MMPSAHTHTTHTHHARTHTHMYTHTHTHTHAHTHMYTRTHTHTHIHTHTCTHAHTRTHTHLTAPTGTDLAQALTAKEVIARKKQAMPPDVAKSLARISSGLYVVTAAHDGARSAMIASWVSQVCVCVCVCASWVLQVCVCVRVCVLVCGCVHLAS